MTPPEEDAVMSQHLDNGGEIRFDHLVTQARGDCHDGGDVIFQAGQPGTSIVPDKVARGGALRFKLHDGTEMLTLLPDGTVLVRGEAVAYQSGLYDGFSAWLIAAGVRM
jgi:hypothetical protein